MPFHCSLWHHRVTVEIATFGDDRLYVDVGSATCFGLGATHSSAYVLCIAMLCSSPHWALLHTGASHIQEYYLSARPFSGGR